MKEFLAFTAIPGSAKITTVSHVVGVAGMENLQCIKRTYCLYEMSAAIQSTFDWKGLVLIYSYGSFTIPEV